MIWFRHIQEAHGYRENNSPGFKKKEEKMEGIKIPYKHVDYR